MRFFGLFAACALATVAFVGGEASAHPKGNGGSQHNQGSSGNQQNQGSSNKFFIKPYNPNNNSGNNSNNNNKFNSNKFTLNTKFFKLAPLNKNGKLKLAWSKKHRHHHHHHREHWCDGDDIDLGDCDIDDCGVMIEELYEGTANDEGMNVGDVILNINGKAIPNIETLRDVVSSAGDVVDMVYINGETGETEAISLYPQNGKIGIYGDTVPVKK